MINIINIIWLIYIIYSEINVYMDSAFPSPPGELMNTSVTITSRLPFFSVRAF